MRLRLFTFKTRAASGTEFIAGAILGGVVSAALISARPVHGYPVTPPIYLPPPAIYSPTPQPIYLQPAPVYVNPHPVYPYPAPGYGPVWYTAPRPYRYFHHPHPYRRW
ncbi:hypothetical protein DU000_08375 [Parvibium lacunae]|uniref:Virulence factor n=1 Tax=Parvibium lacunae TaxID=1888893 RepID=A0A368L1S0_9BURK|nr:hypothetical protein DU000_08375 [Parvibium lacunae]